MRLATVHAPMPYRSSGRSLAVLQSSRGVTLADRAAAADAADIGEVLKELELKIERLKVALRAVLHGHREDGAAGRPQGGHARDADPAAAVHPQHGAALQVQHDAPEVEHLHHLLEPHAARDRERHLRPPSRRRPSARPRRRGASCPPEMRFDKVRPPSGDVQYRRGDQRGRTPKFLDHDTGQRHRQAAAAAHDDLEEVWDRLVSRQRPEARVQRPLPLLLPRPPADVPLLQAPRVRRRRPPRAPTRRHRRRCRRPRRASAAVRARRRAAAAYAARARRRAPEDPRHERAASCARSTSATSTRRRRPAPPPR